MRGIPTAAYPNCKALWSIWQSGLYLGDQRAVTRATIQRAHMAGYNTHLGRWHTLQFGQATAEHEIELPNVAQVTIDRTIDQDAGTARIVLHNLAARTPGQVVDPRDWGLDQRGYYSYNRSDALLARWGRIPNQWADLIVPGRVVRTYQGYGADYSRCAFDDPNLTITGTWLIDDVELDASPPTITLTCRDFAALLIDQFDYPPLVPMSHWPRIWAAKKDVTTASTRAWADVGIRYDDDSGTCWYGHGQPVHGHYGREAFDASAQTYWLSVGNSGPDETWAYEWVQGAVANQRIDAVTVTPWGGNYVCYVSVFAAGRWQGTGTIPYDPNSAPAYPNGADIPYVLQTTIGTADRAQRIELPAGYEHTTLVRVTLHHLDYSDYPPWHYRGGIRSFQVHRRVTIPGKKVKVGNYDDWVDIVRYYCALAGFYWPHRHSANRNVGVGRVVNMPFEPAPSDPILGDGRVFGDFELAGAAGTLQLEAPEFMNKPLMDAITFVRDILGYLFMVSPDGGAVFRSPNIWKVGNYVPPTGAQRAPHVNFVANLDERVHLQALGAKVSRANFRTAVLVGLGDGRTGAAAAGQQTHLGQLMDNGECRVGVYPDANFADSRECQIMADLIWLRQMLTYRTDQVTIAGNPYLDIDDQVRIFERTTGEAFVHYITGVHSDWSAETGVYQQTLDTYWLGERPYIKWIFDPKLLSRLTREYLLAQKKIPHL